MCLGSALDIVAAAKPPRATFVDYPFGHTTGKAFDLDDQLGIVRQALSGLEAGTGPGQINVLPSTWSPDDNWKQVAGAGGGEDKREPRSEEPQFQFAADREAAVAAGALSE